MTSKPAGSQPHRQPQRSLSSNSIQRNNLHSALSSNASARRQNESFIDLTSDTPDTTPNGRNAQTPKNPGSRLKLEMSRGSRSPSTLGGPKAEAALLPSRPPLPPRGRPQLHSDVRVNAVDPYMVRDSNQSEGPLKAMPLPVRPGKHAPPPPHGKARAAPSSATKKDVRPKPYVLEVPAIAPCYPLNGTFSNLLFSEYLLICKGHADFFPWVGNHQEDQFSENVIRQGFYDKTQMTQNETGSAKAALLPALKHKSGLQTLSSLFTSVLSQRRAHGQITTSSTFKPPPRVTVTDTKREMWLRDLANPTISLRRLSRSIPHGIRGKVLLDQSLSKNIPIERAVWLAKCVGANELRSFRRKGASGAFAMGGEAKWIRDFTVCVEQFVESIVGFCGEQDFRRKLNYA